MHHEDDLKIKRSVRPRFRLETSEDGESIIERIEHALERPDVKVEGNVIPGFATLIIPKKDQHYWSPQLTLTIEELEDEMTLVRGLYGPNPSVWTMFVFFYAVIGFAIVILSIIGFSNMSLNQPAGILWLVPVLIVVFLTLYLVSFYGQKLGHDQMLILQDFFEESTGMEIKE